MTNPLNITQVPPSVTNPEVAANAQSDELMGAGFEPVSIDVAAGGTILVSVANFTRFLVFRLTGAPAAAFDLDVPAQNDIPENITRPFIVVNESGQDATVAVSGAGGTTVVVPATETFSLYSDATNIIATGGGGGGGGGNVAVDDEGVEIVAAATRVDFRGSGVVASDQGSGVTRVDIPGPGDTVPVPVEVPRRGALVHRTTDQAISADTDTAVIWEAETYQDTFEGLKFWLGPNLTFTADNTTNRLTATAHGMSTGDGPLQLLNSGGALPTGLATATDYWVIRIDDNTIQLAASFNDSQDNTVVAFTTDGTGTHTLDRESWFVIPGNKIRKVQLTFNTSWDSVSTGLRISHITKNGSASSNGEHGLPLLLQTPSGGFPNQSAGSAVVDVTGGEKFFLRVRSNTSASALVGSSASNVVWFSIDVKETSDAVPFPQSGNAIRAPRLHVADVKTNGTSGGAASTSNIRYIRDLNTVFLNEIAGASLSANQITLPAGKYRISASAPARDVNNHRLHLVDVGGPTDLISGPNSLALATDDDQTIAILGGDFTLQATTTLELRHYINSGNATVFALGSATGEGGTTEKYAEIFIDRLDAAVGPGSFIPVETPFRGATVQRSTNQTTSSLTIVDWESALYDTKFNGFKFWLGVDLNFTADSVTDNLTATAHDMITGDGPLRVSNVGGSLPAGLAASTNYWVIRIDDNTIQLATSFANAIAGTQIDITSNGTGTHTLERASRLVIPDSVTKIRLTANLLSASAAANLTSAMLTLITKNTLAFAGQPIQDKVFTNSEDSLNVVSGVLEVTAGDFFELNYALTGDIDLLGGDNTWFNIAVVETTNTEAPSVSVGFSVLGGTPSSGQLIGKFVVDRPLTLPIGLAGSQGHAGTTDTTQRDFDLQRNGVSIGTVRFAVSTAEATFIAATETNLIAGDRLELFAPSPAVATLADIAVTIAAAKA